MSEMVDTSLFQINSLSENIISRKKKAFFYNSILKIYTEDYMYSENNIFLRYSFLIKNRDYWELKFSKLIDLSIWFKTIASGKVDNFDEIFYRQGTCQNAEFATQHIFNLPTHNWINENKLESLLIELKNSGDIIKTN